MEIGDENQRSCKRSRSRGGKNNKDEDEDGGEAKLEEVTTTTTNNNSSMIRHWHQPSSRIFRVSRASGGKDRHSKVYTSKGLRDRRVRLSVSTAIQFYDLQDRLGYDQPSKAIEWLIKSAAPAIADLPSLDTTFPELQQGQQQQLLAIEKAGDSVMDADAEPSYNQQQNSSTSETSKGSVLSRSEIRTKARERARERVKEKDRDDSSNAVSNQNHQQQQQNVDPSLNSQGSFTKLLTGCSSAQQPSSSTASFIQKQMQSLPPVTSTADYFSTQSSLFGQQQQQQQESPKATHHQIQSHSQSGFSAQAHFGNNNSPVGMVPLMSNSGDPPAEMQQFAFLPEHYFPVAAANGGDYNLNFSPSLAGFHRGTLQSNSPFHHHNHHHHSHSHSHHQVQAPTRLCSALDGSSVPFFFSTAATAGSPTENPNPYASSGFNGHLQPFDGYKQLELKGKGKG